MSSLKDAVQKMQEKVVGAGRFNKAIFNMENALRNRGIELGDASIGQERE